MPSLWARVSHCRIVSRGDPILSEILISLPHFLMYMAMYLIESMPLSAHLAISRSSAALVPGRNASPFGASAFRAMPTVAACGPYARGPKCFDLQVK